MVEQLGAGSRVEVLQLLDGDLWLHVDDAQDERCVLDLGDTVGRRPLVYNQGRDQLNMKKTNPKSDSFLVGHGLIGSRSVADR